MKTIVSLISALTTLAVSSAMATTYTGPGTGDGSVAGDGGAISSVVVNNTASTITFSVNSTAVQASYIFYTIELHVIGAPIGDTSLINPWGPHIGASTGLNAIINTYGTGASELSYGGGVWTQNASGNYDAGGTGSSFFTVTASLSSLGLNTGDSFYFDVVSSYTNPSGQSGYSALDNTGGFPAESNSSFTPWTGPTDPNYYDSATDANGSTFGAAASLYTVTAVPEPATCALVGLGALVMVRRAVFRKA